MIDKKLRGKDLIGRKCRPTCQLRNGAGQGISPDSVCTIMNVIPGHGFTIRSDNCPNCGQFAWMTHVERKNLELVDEAPTNYRRACCLMRHENGNCLPMGGFCTSVNDEICKALHGAFNEGWIYRIEVELGGGESDD